MTVTQLTSSFFSAPINFVDVLQMPVMLPLSQFTDDELRAFPLIASFDISSGCGEQCITCGADAPPRKPSQDMPWERAISIPTGILAARERVGGEHVPISSSITLYDGSSPDAYVSVDRKTGERKYYADVAREFNKKLGARICVTMTPIGKGSVRNRLFESIRADSTRASEERIFTTSWLSIKTVTRSARAEFDKYLDKLIADIFTTPECDLKNKFRASDIRAVLYVRQRLGERYANDHVLLGKDLRVFAIPPDAKIDRNGKVVKVRARDFTWIFDQPAFDFLQTSQWIQNLMHSVGAMRDSDVKFLIQYMNVTSFENVFNVFDLIPPKYERYRYFFSKRFLERVEDLVLGASIPRVTSSHAFSGLGKAVKELRMPMVGYVRRAQNDIASGYINFSEKNWDGEINLDQERILWAMNCFGEMKFITAASSHSLSIAEIPSAYFLDRAAFHEIFADGPDGPHVKIAARYRALASLASGRNVFPDRDHQPLSNSPKNKNVAAAEAGAT